MPRYFRKRVDDTITSGFNPYQTWLIVVWYFNYVYIYVYIYIYRIYYIVNFMEIRTSDVFDVTYKHVLCSVLQYRHWILQIFNVDFVDVIQCCFIREKEAYLVGQFSLLCSTIFAISIFCWI